MEPPPPFSLPPFSRIPSGYLVVNTCCFSACKFEGAAQQRCTGYLGNKHTRINVQDCDKNPPSAALFSYSVSYKLRPSCFSALRVPQSISGPAPCLTAAGKIHHIIKILESRNSEEKWSPGLNWILKHFTYFIKNLHIRFCILLLTDYMMNCCHTRPLITPVTFLGIRLDQL